MDLIIAIFMYLGLLNPGQMPTNADIQTNQYAIDQIKNDQQFLQYYETHKTPGVVTLDHQEW